MAFASINSSMVVCTGNCTKCIAKHGECPLEDE